MTIYIHFFHDINCRKLPGPVNFLSKIKSRTRSSSTRSSFTACISPSLKTAVLRSSLQCSFIHDIYMLMSSQHQRYMAVHKASVEIALHQIHRANCRAPFHHSAFFTIASLDAMFFKCNTQSQYFASTCLRRTFYFVCSVRTFLFAACGFILFAACKFFCL